ncbi:MAG TPA: NAD(P)/FAD-dependent oxidoreductase [Acidimicrobiia bacterium]|nr:NAD(P)/FAD-dependent oxidoreductase [Acidimicrobiia bacterium]
MKPTAEELFGPAGTPRVAVVGAGFGGIAAGVKLTRAGIRTFTIYESSLGIGGTWWDNTYPGAEVDVGSHLYCFSFKPHDWTRTHAKQPELQKYLEETVDEFGLRAHLRLGVTVESATWDDDRHVWTLRLDDGTSEDFHVLVSGVGFLNVPRYPDWPGLDGFVGPSFHTARWEHQHDLTGKVVAVVGTGSSATQVVPAIQPIVKQLYLFQREPGWVLPKGERDLTDEQRAAFTKPWRRVRERFRLKYVLERNLWRGAIYRPGTKANRAREEVCRRYIARQFKDRPDLREAVTPGYPYPGKRPVLASTFYPALKKDNVELVPRAVSSVTRTGVVDANGVERAVDAIVMATGFQPTNYLARLPVVGRDGRTLQDRWAGEPRAYLGITVPRFPNFFMLYGPGTNGGEIVSMLEAQASYVVRVVKRMTRERVTAVEVRPRFEAAWWRWLQSRMEGTSWTMSNNYFTSPTGKVVTQWPYGNAVYVALTKLMGRVSETTRSRPRRVTGGRRRGSRR